MQLERADRLGLQVVVTQHERGNFVLHARQELIALRARQCARGDQRIEQYLDVDLEIRGIHARGVVYEVGVQSAAGERVFDPAALREAEVAAFADDPRGKLCAVDAHAIVAAIADFAVRLVGRLDVGADPTVPEQIDPHAQDSADDFIWGRGGAWHAEQGLRLAREGDRFCGAWEYAAAARNPTTVIVIPARARQSKETLALGKARRRIRGGIEKDVLM